MVGLAEVRNYFLSILQTLAITRCVFVACGHVGLDTLGGIARRVFETSPFGRTRTERRRHTRIWSFEVEKTSLDVSVGSVHVSEGRVNGLHSSSCFRRTLDFSLGKNVVLCIFTEKREGGRLFNWSSERFLMWIKAERTDLAIWSSDEEQSEVGDKSGAPRTKIIFKRKTIKERMRANENWSILKLLNTKRETRDDCCAVN